MNFLKKISSTGNIIFILFVLLLTICFETFQQLFYIERFSLFENVQFFELLKNQFYRWIIWFVVGILLVFIVRKDVKKEPDFRLFFKYFIIIILLVALNILVISTVQMVISKAEVTISDFFSEYFLFYVFQKSPIYILGYIAITIILFLSFSKEILQIEVQELIELKNHNDKVYKKLKEVSTDKAKILNIKIGNKRKIIPVADITWLEADDYCVIVHTINNPSYSMRSTLKSLEEKLEDNFLRVHRKGIVNMDKVKEYNLATNPRVILINNQEVTVSKSNLKLVKSFLEK